MLRDLIDTLLICTVILGLLVLPIPARSWDRAAEPYIAQLVREAQFRFGIPAPAPVIAAQVQQESHWNPNARSQAGALGLMQFMPKTAQWADVQAGFGGVDAMNPSWSLRAGAWYDRWLYDRVHADDECTRWQFTLASYNGGLGNLYKRQEMSDWPGNWHTRYIRPPKVSVSNQRENQEYPVRILYRHQLQFRTLGKTECL